MFFFFFVIRFFFFLFYYVWALLFFAISIFPCPFSFFWFFGFFKVPCVYFCMYSMWIYYRWWWNFLKSWLNSFFFSNLIVLSFVYASQKSFAAKFLFLALFFSCLQTQTITPLSKARFIFLLPSFPRSFLFYARYWDKSHYSVFFIH